MKVAIVYATPRRQFWVTVDLPDGATVNDAVERSTVLKQFPEIDLARQRIGVFGKVTTLDAVLADGDRVEIYRPLTVDPKTVRQKAKPGKSEASAPD